MTEAWIRILATDFTLPGVQPGHPKEAVLNWLDTPERWLLGVRRADQPVRTRKREKLLSLMMAGHDHELSNRERWTSGRWPTT